MRHNILTLITIILFVSLSAFLPASLTASETEAGKSSYMKGKLSVGEPIIEVTDIDFGNLSVGKKVSKAFFIRNLGTVDLRITGIEGNFLSVYTNDLRKVSPQNPLIITQGGDLVSVSVVFAPNAEGSFVDSIVFISDAGTKIDNVALIKGVGIKPGLIANSYDWGRCRIDRPNFPRGPYDTKWVPGQPEAIVLENNGSEEVRIERIDIVTIKGNPSSFIFNHDDFNIILSPGVKKLINVEFQPKSVGEHEIEIEYLNTAGIKVKSTLKGIGILPMVITSDVDFGVAAIGDTAKPRNRKVRFTNLNYPWADTLTITNFIAEPTPVAISDSPKMYGTEGFRFIKDTVLSNKPAGKIVLKAGEFIEFDAWFAAQQDGNHMAKLKTVSDAGYEAQSVWTGIGSNKSVFVTGDVSKICLGLADTLSAIITNYSAEDITISQLSFKNVLPEFSFLNPNDVVGFILNPGESKIIKIIFHSTTTGKFKAELVFKNDSKDNPDATAELYVDVVILERISFLSPAMQEKSIGENASVSVMLQDGESIKTAMLDSLLVEIDYDNEFLKPVGVNIGNALQTGKYGTAPGYPKIIESAGKVIMLILSYTDEHFDVSGEILNLIFHITEPTGSKTVAEISHLIVPTGNSCVVIQPDTKVEIRLKPLGAEDGFTNLPNFQVISPNPMTREGGELYINSTKKSALLKSKSIIVLAD